MLGVVRDTMKETISTSMTMLNSKGLLEAAEFLLKNIIDTEVQKCPNRLPYILAVAAFMEAKLNEAILHWGVICSPIASGTRHAKAFLTMNLRSKLDTIFFIYSNATYLTNIDSKEYKALAHLISIRNQVAHSKPYAATLEIEYTDIGDGAKSFTLPHEFVEKSTSKAYKLTVGDLEFLLKAAKELDRALDYEESYSSSPLCKNVQQKNPADR